jgi:Arc/MetJ-type ribon-helix-helix transcriptional regulator
MKTIVLNVSLPPHHSEIVRRFRKAGRFQSNREVVCAALQRLEEAEWDPDAYPPGSLTHLYTPARNAEELELNKVSSLQVDHDE